tara:strand:+ start:5083 stop:5412 length:330 start_codon:yes stop_codon:yes gene_type:complete
MKDWTPPRKFTKYGDEFTLVDNGGEDGRWCIYEREFIPCYDSSAPKSYQLIVFRYQFGKIDGTETAGIPWSLWGTYGWTYGPYSRGSEAEETLTSRAFWKFEEKIGTPV